MHRVQIHPDRPNYRVLSQVASSLKNEGIVVYPTDSTYALGCSAYAHDAPQRIAQLRGQNFRTQRMTLICPSLSKLAEYAGYDKKLYRLLRQCTPGPYTFIMTISRELPRRLADKRKHIGLRIPDDPIAQALLEVLDEPLLSTSLILPGEEQAVIDPNELPAALEQQVDWILDAGDRSPTPTTIIDCTEDIPAVTRQGLGPDPFVKPSNI